jgi:hypothetical protein
MQRRTLLVALAVTAGGLTSAAPALAQNPPGCKQSRLHVDIGQDHDLVRIGDTINYSIDSDNIGVDACDVQNVNINLQFPGLDGNPSSTLQNKLAGQTFKAQQLFPALGPYAYTVAANAGVGVVSARVSVEKAVLQDIAKTPVNIDKGISAKIFTPSITIDKTADKTGPLPAPQDVTYTFYVRNGADPTLPAAATALANVKVTDDKCGSPVYSKGDDGDGLLEIGEVWEFTCKMTHPAPGTYHNVATASGDNILYGRTVPVVSPPDDWTVVLVAPVAPPPPQGAVKPVAVNQAPCQLSRVNSTTVRARQLNTIRVRVRNMDAGTRVTLKVPGGKKYTAKTNKDGLATFRVRPTKSGRATISAPECSDVERLSVKPARKVVAQRAPRVTG